jgi:exopolysaccharide production protein ExoQ
MPPPLALILCTIFVLGALWVEQSRSQGVSLGAWIPTVWMLAVSSKPLAIWFGVTGDNEAGSLPDRLLLTALTLVGVVLLVRRRSDLRTALRRNAWLLALLAYMFVSTLWSDISAIALRRWTREAIVLIMALVILSEDHPRRALESLLRRSAYILVPCSLMLIKYFPELGVDYANWSGQRMWIGVTLHKNALSGVCLVSAFFLLWAIYRRWREGVLAGRTLLNWADLSVLLVALFLLKGEDNSYSATSLATMSVGLATFAALVWLRKLNISVSQLAVLAFVAFLIGFGASAPFLEGSNVAAFSSLVGRDETLTGRTETWTALLPVVMSHPLLGCGFGSFWTTARREFYSMSNGHNGYLDVLLELGFLGFGLYMAWVLSCVRRLHRSLAQDYHWASLGLCLVPMALVYNTAESAFSSLSNQLPAVLVLVSMVVPFEAIPVAARSPRVSRLRASRTRLSAPHQAPRGDEADRGHARPLREVRRRPARGNPVHTPASGWRRKEP